MPIAIGLLPSQQESFEHHEELSKLSNETDVFYVPFQNDFHNNQDLSDLTKRFDEDILNKHLVVTFRNIGYSLFLDAVQSIPDQNDHSKTRVSGKMIVDGICIQFLGCFDCYNKIQENSDVQRINGVGRVRLDEDYYRELASTQILIDERSLESTEQTDFIGESERSFLQKKTRSRTISENILGKNANHILKSPPSSLSNSRSRLHSPSHLPYTTRSPRTMTNANKQQHQASSPINIDSSSVSRSSGFHSSFISPSSSATSSYNENPIELPSQNHIKILSQSPQFSSSLHNPCTMPIPIPSSKSSNNGGMPSASFTQLAGLFPVTQSHSLPTYFLPQSNLTYLLTQSNQPLHIIKPFNHHPVEFPSSLQSQATCINDSSSMSQHKRHDNDETKQVQPMDTNKQLEEQLPFKKRRYTGQQASVNSPMDTDHHEHDDDASNDSVKK